MNWLLEREKNYVGQDLIVGIDWIVGFLSFSIAAISCE